METNGAIERRDVLKYLPLVALLPVALGLKALHRREPIPDFYQYQVVDAEDLNRIVRAIRELQVG